MCVRTQTRATDFIDLLLITFLILPDLVSGLPRGSTPSLPDAVQKYEGIYYQALWTLVTTWLRTWPGVLHPLGKRGITHII